MGAVMSEPLLNLTEPQLNLLMDLRERPRALDKSYRPLKPLIAQELVRGRALGMTGTNLTYELTTKGQKLTQRVLETLAAIDETRTT